jgi:hypothetical protein
LVLLSKKRRQNALKNGAFPFTRNTKFKKDAKLHRKTEYFRSLGDCNHLEINVKTEHFRSIISKVPVVGCIIAVNNLNPQCYGRNNYRHEQDKTIAEVP